MLRHVFCLGWGGRIEEGHGHEVLAPCLTVCQGLLGLELLTTREILNGNFRWKLGVGESPSRKQSLGGSGWRGTICCFACSWQTDWGTPGAARWWAPMAEDDQIPFPEAVPVVSGLPRAWQGLLKNGPSWVTKSRHRYAAFLSTLRVANPPSPSLSKHPTKLHRFALESTSAPNSILELGG